MSETPERYECEQLVIDGWKAIGYIPEDMDNDMLHDTFWFHMKQFTSHKFVSPNGNLRHYSITLTYSTPRTKQDLLDTCRKVLLSRSVQPEFYEWCLEKTKKGVDHIHIYLTTKMYVRARDILRFNDKQRIQIDSLRGIAISKWRNYIAKEGTPLTELPEQ